MSKCSCGEKTIFEGMIIEINAGKIISNGLDAIAYNQGCQRAIDIIKKYEAGNGLFQQCPVHGNRNTSLTPAAPDADAPVS